MFGHVKQCSKQELDKVIGTKCSNFKKRDHRESEDCNCTKPLDGFV